MKNISTDAGVWMAANGSRWGKPKPEKSGKHAKHSATKTMRKRRGKNLGTARSEMRHTVLEFADLALGQESPDCIFVPGAQEGVPAAVWHMGRNISAARYVCIHANGLPASDGMVARHRCGNGHISCVNPKHICWGTPGDNIGDAARHRKSGDNVQDRINSIPS